ncbi:MAG: ParB/RepB/Spo0J family partition protein [Eubacterium sp.]|nr:ParB/RepB/Spo0J family partition protein [Eubacterium sp.]
MSSADKIQLKGFNDLFNGSSPSEEESFDSEVVQDGKLMDIAVTDLYEFKDHPFIVRDDEKLAEMVESIKKVGVINPCIARVRPEGGYELISGHTRKEACIRAGLKTVPVYVRDLDDDMAAIIMVDSNLQREDLLPSEKAKAYRMKYEALLHRGKAGEVKGVNSLEMVAEGGNDGSKTVQRYVQIAKLPEYLLNLIDKHELSIRAGVELSYIDEKNQVSIVNFLKEHEQTRISEADSKELRKCGKEYSPRYIDMVWEILVNAKKKPRPKYVSIKRAKLVEFFDDEASSKDIEDVIIRLLEGWKGKEGSQDGRDDTGESDDGAA